MIRNGTAKYYPLVIYASCDCDQAERFFRATFGGTIPQNLVGICPSLDKFQKYLQKSKGNPILVLLCTCIEELLFFLSIRSNLHDHRIMLILPNRKADTIRQAHKLYPRFISYADGDFQDVSAVLGKMLAFQNRLCFNPEAN